MKKFKDRATSAFLKTGIHRLLNRFVASGGRYAILMYHRILPCADPFQPSVSFDDFSSDVNFIARNFNLVPLSALGGTAPKRAVAITIDDGHREVYDLVYPLVREKKVPLTIFVVSDFTGTDAMLPTTEIGEMLKRAEGGSLELEVMRGRTFPLNSVGKKLACLDEIKSFLKSSPPENGGAILDELRGKLGPLPAGGRTMLSWEEIRDMRESAVDVGSHSRSHCILSRLDAGRAWEEIAGSKRVIESQLGRKIVSFCYPNGKESDFTEETMAMVREAGYSLAVTTLEGVNDRSSNRYALRRLWTERCSRSNLYARMYRSFLKW